MSKTVKIILIILIADFVLVGIYFGCKVLSKGGNSSSSEYEWIQIDENYYPQDYIEEFIKSDSQSRDLLPVFIKNYKKDAKILKKFRGRHFAGPSTTEVRMKYRNMEDWQLVELKFTNEDEREIQRTVLYIMESGVWKVGDTGVLSQ